MTRYLTLSAALIVSAVLAQDALDDRFQRAYYQEHALKDLDQAVETYRGVFRDALQAKQRALAARAKLREALCERQRGREVEAVALLEQLVKDFADQNEVQAEAKDALAALGGPRRTLRVYDVSYLLTRAHEADPLAGMQLAESRSSSSDGTFRDPRGGVLSFDDEAWIAPGISIDPDVLIDLITENLASGFWEGSARISVEGGNLVVVNTAEVHREVEALLGRLQALRGRAITFDVRSILITEQGLRALQLGSGGARALTPAQTQALEAQLAAKRAFEIERRQLSTSNRIGVEAATPLRHDFLGTYELNQTGVVPVLNPVIEQGTEATAVWLRPTLVASGEHMLLEVHARASRWNTDATQLLQPEQKAELDLPVVHYAALEETLLVKGGQPILIGGVHVGPPMAEIDLAKLDPQAGWTEDVAQTARLVFVVTPRAEAPAETKQEAPVTKGRRELRVYNVALVLGERRAPRSLELQTLLSELGADEDETRRALDPDVLLEMLRENIAPDSWEHPSNWIQLVGDDVIAISQTPAVQASVRSFLSTLERGPGTSQTVALELLDLELPAARLSALLDGAQGGRGSEVLAAQAVDALLAEATTRVTRWGAGSSVSGTGLGCEATRSERYLSGCENSSGGTGSVIQEETQPLTGVARSGWSLAALPRAMRDGRVALNLAYRVDSLLRFKRVDLGFATIGLPQLRNDVKRVNTAFDPTQVLLVASEVRGGAGRLVLVRVRVDSPLGE